MRKRDAVDLVAGLDRIAHVVGLLSGGRVEPLTAEELAGANLPIEAYRQVRQRGPK